MTMPSDFEHQVETPDDGESKLSAPDWDNSYCLGFVNNDDDFCYIEINKDLSGYWVWVSVDCASKHCSETLCDKDGPYTSYIEAVEAGLTCCIEWGICSDLFVDETDLAKIRTDALIDQID